jgi:hypothetical protein
VVESTTSAFSFAAARASARASRRAVGGSEAAANPFRVQENVVATLTDMGFTDGDVRRMAAAHRTNSISALTTHLLELGSSAMQSAAAVTGDSAAPVAADGVAEAASDPDSAYATATAASGLTAGVGVILPPERLEMQTSESLDSDTTPQPIIAGGCSDDTQNSVNITTETLQQPCELVLTTLKPLPLIPRRPTENLQKSKTFLHQILRKTLSMVPLSCLRLIERGVVKARGEWGIEVSSVNQVDMTAL